MATAICELNEIRLVVKILNAKRCEPYAYGSQHFRKRETIEKKLLGGSKHSAIDQFWY